MRRLILIPLIALCGCSAQYKQQRDIKKLQSLVLQQPNEFARLSDLLNPCFDGTAKSDTIISLHTDTLFEKGISDTVRINDTIRITKTLPGKQINHTRTVTIRDTVKDGRSEAYLKSQLQVKSDSLVISKTQLSQTKKSRNIWMWIAIGAILIIVVSIVIKAYKFFTTGGLSSLKSIIK